MRKGYFLTLEGPDGSGKSTVAERLLKELNGLGYEVVLTREPGGTEIGEDIREILLSNRNSEMCSRTEALLYAASRAQHVSEKIRPAIEAGKIVISDRFVYSSLAYQGIARGLGVNEVMGINEFAMDKMYPDRVIFFDISPEITLKRKTIGRELDRLEMEGLNFHNLVYNGYKEAIAKYPHNVIEIDADKTEDEVFKNCLKIILEDLR